MPPGRIAAVIIGLVGDLEGDRRLGREPSPSARRARRRGRGLSAGRPAVRHGRAPPGLPRRHRADPPSTTSGSCASAATARTRARLDQLWGRPALAGRRRHPDADRRLRPRHDAAARPSLGAGRPLLRRARRCRFREPPPLDREHRLVAVRGDPRRARRGRRSPVATPRSCSPTTARGRRTAPHRSPTPSGPTRGAGRTRRSPTPRREPSRSSRGRCSESVRGCSPTVTSTSPARPPYDSPGAAHETTIWSLAANKNTGNVRLLDLDTLTDARALDGQR